MTRLRAFILLSVFACTLLPARAATPRSTAYLATRADNRICRLTLTQARRSGGHQGKVVEWAGRVQGVAISGDGVFMFLRLNDGQTIPVRARGGVTLAIGTAVYVLGRVSESSGLIHHLEPIAIAPCSDVLQAQAETQQRHEVAQRRADEARKAAAARPATVAGDPCVMRMDPHVLAARAGTLSLKAATDWIKQFNRNLDDATTTVLARTILYYCGAYGVDSRLALSLFAAESCFRHDATSSAGAMGIGQLMPGTASMLGVRDPYDALQNAEGSIRHISTLLTRWKGSPSQYQLTLASYNAGAGAVEQYGGIPPYPETVSYVKIILGYYGELCRCQ